MSHQDAPGLNADVRAKLNRANQMFEQAKNLMDEAEELLEPFAMEVLQQLSQASPEKKDDIRRLIDQLPRGSFYRTELRTAFITKFGRD